MADARKLVGRMMPGEHSVDDGIVPEDMLVEPDFDAILAEANSPTEVVRDQDVEEFDGPDEPESDEDEIRSLDQMADDEELVPGGPKAKEVRAWKEQFGSVYVMLLAGDKVVFYRPINRFEYKRLLKNMEQLMNSGKLTENDATMYNEEAICELCCLFPKYTRADFNSELAGLPSSVSQSILDVSGFAKLDVRPL